MRIHKESAFQVRSYGYTAGHLIAVLTNFRTLRIYDTRLEPKATDDPDVGLLISIDYQDFISKFDEIIAVLGREQVASGAIERIFGVRATGAIPANTAFLNRINKWRLLLSQDLHTRYPKLSIVELSDFTQKIINRIIFIRMCEDRGIESEEMLHKAACKKNIIEVRALFKRMDDRYDTGLFDVSEDRLQDLYEVGTNVFLQIVDEVYAPNSPYSFSVLDADFLGQVYELFLGERLAFASSGKIVLEPKPTHENREIVTTPQALVDEVVHRTVKAKLSQSQLQSPITIDSIKALRVCDVAVGSSRFLLRVFDELIEATIEILRKGEDRSLLYRITDNNYKLVFQAKKEILRNCLFGIDIDYNAVEIARFSLIVRLLEDESIESLPSGRNLLPISTRTFCTAILLLIQTFSSNPAQFLTRLYR